MHRRFVALSVSLFFGSVVAVLAGYSQKVDANDSPPAVSWNGVTLGQPASSLRSSIGDPLRVSNFDGGRRIARYWLYGDTTYFLVIEHRGYIAGFNEFSDPAPTSILQNVAPDPSGARLGETLDAIKESRPFLRATVDDDGNPELIGKTSANVVAVYTFEGGRLSTFQWGTSVPDSQPELPPIVESTGLSTAQAILDVQKNESEGVRWEYRYLAFHPCSNAGAHWQLSKQSLVQDGDRRFDVLHVVCATKTERDFYFDITSFYGKI